MNFSFEVIKLRLKKKQLFGPPSSPVPIFPEFLEDRFLFSKRGIRKNEEFGQ